MGLFDFFKKKNENKGETTEVLAYLKTLSNQATDLAISEIEETDSFLPFGGVLTTEKSFQMLVYHDPSKTNIDHREHATIIQNLIMQKYKDPKNVLFFMAWDGVAHLASGDIDCINVKVDDKINNIHKIYIYTYKKINGKVILVDKENPTINDV